MDRLYFTPTQVDFLTERLDEPREVYEDLGAGGPDRLDTIINYCDSLNSTLKAARFISLPLSGAEREILAYAVTHTKLAQMEPWKRGAPTVIKNLKAKLAGADVEFDGGMA